MPGLESLGRMLIVLGIFTLAVGVLLVLAGKLPGVGRLPGDILIRRGNFTFYFPIVTSIVLSLILTLVLNLFLRRR